MRHLILALLAALVAVPPFLPAAAEAPRGTLRAVSLEVVEIFNAADGAALARLVAGQDAAQATADALARRLAECRRRFGPLERISLPTMGARTYGLFAAYFPGVVRDLFLEIDGDGRIRLLTIVGADGSCSLAGPAASEAA